MEDTLSSLPEPWLFDLRSSKQFIGFAVFITTFADGFLYGIVSFSEVILSVIPTYAIGWILGSSGSSILVKRSFWSPRSRRPVLDINLVDRFRTCNGIWCANSRLVCWEM
jgi:hypothetical protein